MADNSELTSGVLTSPADALLSAAIATTLNSEAALRAAVFTAQVRQIEAYMASRPQERPWTCRVLTGTDGSVVFRGGVGHSLVIDREGRLWRARSYEDFDTTYVQVGEIFDVDAVTPLYAQMRQYRQA
jgi:hypothetical protein